MKKIIEKIIFAVLISLITISSVSSSVSAARTPDNNDANLTSQIPTTDDLIFDNAVCNLPSAPDLTTTYASYILDTTKYNPHQNSTSTINDVKASYQAAINDTTNGTWFVSYGRNNNGEYIRVAWTRDPNAYLQWESHPSPSHPSNDYQQVNLTSDGTGSGEATIQCDSSNNYFWGVKTAYTGVTNSNLTLQGRYFYTTSLFYLYSSNFGFAYNYPTGYSGLPISNMPTDSDSDGLTTAQETAQETSDTNSDTDGDGLDDYIESPWNPDRDDIFCGTECAYPSPTKKDLYVEIDWMKDLSNNTYKPSSTQLGLVESMFDTKGINFHADTGQFGGGNELSTYTQTLSNTVTPGQIDFWDYKDGVDGIPANFSPDRNLVWRYMISGYNYLEFPGSSGWAQTMGDDLFISDGLIEDTSGLASLDRAIANTIAHEVGHTLCLSDERYFTEQPEECVFNGIDNNSYKPENYESVMNYRYQLTDDDDMGVVDYSDGGNSTDDHDDWSAVMLGMGGFSGTRTAPGKIIDNYYVSPKGNVYSVSPDGSIIVPKIPIESIRESSKEAVLDEIQRQTQNDAVLPTDFSQPTGGSTAERFVEEPTESPSFDWTAMLSGGAALAVVVMSATWYYLRK